MKRFVLTPCSSRCKRVLLLYMWTHLASFAIAPPAWAATAAVADAGRGSWLMGELLVIALVAACGWAVLYVLKRRNRLVHGEAEPVRVVGGTMLGGRERVVMLQARGRLFLLGVTPHNVSLLAELDQAAPDRLQEPRGAPTQASPAG